MNDEDLQLLDAYLDGELTPAEQAALQTRLEQEPQLTAALAEARTRRDLCRAVFATYEPSSEAASEFVAHLHGKLAARRHWETALRAARLVTAAAACIVIGFTVGWLGRSPRAVQVTQQNPRIQMIDRPDPSGYHLAVTDSRGDVLAAAPARSLDEARRFVEEVHRYPAVRRAVLGVLVSETVHADRPAIRIEGVSADSPAARAGLQRGDVIRAVGDAPVASVADFARVIAARRGPTDLHLIRNGQAQTIHVELGGE